MQQLKTLYKMLRPIDTGGLTLQKGNKEALAYYRNIDNLYKISSQNMSDGVCIDLGSHVGIFALKVAQITNCVVHTYEPHPQNYNALVNHIYLNKLYWWIIPFNEAVWNTNGYMKLSIDPENGSSDSHTLHNIKGWNKLWVKTVSPKTIFNRVKSNIEYLKVNCEGGEYYLLKYLVNHPEIPIERMCIEVHPDMLGDNLQETIEMLRIIKERYKKLKIMFASLFVQSMNADIMSELKVDTL